MTETRASTSQALLFIAVALAFHAPSAAADDTWTAPYEGVRHLRRTASRTDLHAILIDLTQADVSFVATKQQDRMQSVGDFARRYGADVAINANYFDVGSKSCGLAVGDGKIWSDSYEEGCAMSVAFGMANRVAMFDSSARHRGPLPESWMTQVVSGKPWLVRDGVLQAGWYSPRHIRARHPRTAIGLTKDRHTLIIAVVDGRRSTAVGMNGRELAALMEELGAHDAINLDGGGSSALYLRAEGGMQNKPSGRTRRVSMHLGIRVTPHEQPTPVREAKAPAPGRTVAAAQGAQPSRS